MILVSIDDSFNIFRQCMIYNETQKFSAYMEPDRLQKRYRMKRSSDFSFAEKKNGSRSKRAIPHIIYPEILVIVDYDGYRLHGGDNTQVGIIFLYIL